MTSPVSGATSSAPPSATTSVDRPDQMDKDTFLKLLVAQMKYQDPSNPASSSELMAQTATFSQVEQLENIATQNTSLLALQRSLSAGALVGQTVSYTDTTGVPQVGVVSSVTIATDSSPSMATVDGVQVDVGRITKVSTPVAETARTAATTPATTAPATTAAPDPAAAPASSTSQS